MLIKKVLLEINGCLIYLVHSSTKEPSQEASPSFSESIIDEASTPANETSCPSIPDSANDKSTSTLDDNRTTPQKLTYVLKMICLIFEN